MEMTHKVRALRPGYDSETRPTRPIRLASPLGRRRIMRCKFAVAGISLTERVGIRCRRPSDAGTGGLIRREHASQSGIV